MVTLSCGGHVVAMKTLTDFLFKVSLPINNSDALWLLDMVNQWNSLLSDYHK
jgi:hypothetical protein